MTRCQLLRCSASAAVRGRKRSSLPGVAPWNPAAAAASARSCASYTTKGATPLPARRRWSEAFVIARTRKCCTGVASVRSVSFRHLPTLGQAAIDLGQAFPLARSSRRSPCHGSWAMSVGLDQRRARDAYRCGALTKMVRRLTRSKTRTRPSRTTVVVRLQRSIVVHLVP
jgi:hypothetical protein